jgi:hypothetical protein
VLESESDLLHSLAEMYASMYEGKVAWDDPKSPLISGYTPREKNRAKRISTGVENPNSSPSDKQLERYGKLKDANETQSNIRQPKTGKGHFYTTKAGPNSYRKEYGKWTRSGGTITNPDGPRETKHLKEPEDK